MHQRDLFALYIKSPVMQIHARRYQILEECLTARDAEYPQSLLFLLITGDAEIGRRVMGVKGVIYIVLSNNTMLDVHKAGQVCKRLLSGERKRPPPDPSCHLINVYQKCNWMKGSLSY
jgi:hypothetical protein